jgi:class 3 adenylate cyclase
VDQPKRRLSAVWFADIVGYTPLSARDEPLALRLITELQTLARSIVVQEFEGRIVKFVGDAVLAEFGSTESAVRSAVALQERYSARAEELGAPSQLRTGVHLGEVVATSDGDLYGDGINTAARLQGEASPGQVIVSEDVWRQLRQRPEFRFESLGGVELRGITTRVEVYNVLFGARAALKPPPDPPRGSTRRGWRGVVAVAGTAAIVALTLWWARAPQSDSSLPTASFPAPGVEPTAAVQSQPRAAAPPAGSAAVEPAPAASSARADLPAPAASPGAARDAPSRPAESAARPVGADAPAPDTFASGGRGGRVGEVRTFLEEFAAALALDDPAPTARRLFPAIPPSQLSAWGDVRRQFGSDVRTRLGRIEDLGGAGGTRNIRFVVMVASSTRRAVTLAFDAAIVRQDDELRFIRLQRVTGPGTRGRPQG